MLHQEDTYQIHLPQFDGPFDLLLFFVDRDELDIYDIPISKITRDFMAYIKAMERMQLSIAAEFILMAAKLMKIKAAMLIPRPQLDEAGNPIDPRTELLDRLLEYKKFAGAAAELSALEDRQMNVFRRGYTLKEQAEAVREEDVYAEELYGLTLYRLLVLYARLLEKQQQRSRQPTHVIQAFPYTVEQVKSEIVSFVQLHHKVHFPDIVQLNSQKIYVVFGVLCILELVNNQRLGLLLGEGHNNFWLLEKDQPPATDAA